MVHGLYGHDGAPAAPPVGLELKREVGHAPTLLHQMVVGPAQGTARK